jgi:hypothetical protein
MPSQPRKRTLVDPETGEFFEHIERTRKRGDMYALSGSYTPVSDAWKLNLLHKDSGFTRADRDVLDLHIHGAHGDRHTGALRMTRQEIADFLGISLRTVASSLKKLIKAELIFASETHGRLTYYKATAHIGSRDGGAAQQELAKSQPTPKVKPVDFKREAS